MQKTLKLSELVISEELTELRPINAYKVSEYRQAYRAGNDLGTPIIEAKTNVVVSGNHRVTAMMREFGEDHKITVEARKFKDKAALLKTFAQENIGHGLPLDGRSRRAIVIAMANAGVSSQEAAQIFGVSIKRVEEWSGQLILVRGDPKGKPLKHGAEHMAGKTVPKAEADRHARLDRGIPVRSMCRQLTRWLEDDWVDRDDQAAVDALEVLQTALAAWHERHAVTN